MLHIFFLGKSLLLGVFVSLAVFVHVFLKLQDSILLDILDYSPLLGSR
jgi:hypothetical protein